MDVSLRVDDYGFVFVQLEMSFPQDGHGSAPAENPFGGKVSVEFQQQMEIKRGTLEFLQRYSLIYLRHLR